MRLRLSVSVDEREGEREREFVFERDSWNSEQSQATKENAGMKN